MVWLDGRQIRLVTRPGFAAAASSPRTSRYSLLRSLRALQRSDVGLLVIDASAGASAQDRHIAGYAVEAGAGFVVAANKWDLVKHEDRVDAGFLKEAPAVVLFVPGAVLTLSATEHRNLKRVMPAVLAVADARSIHIPTPTLNNLIRNALDEHPPRIHKGRRLKILYATQARSPVPDHRPLRQRSRVDALRLPALPREPDPRGLRLRGGAPADRHPASRRERRLRRSTGLMGPGA